MTYEQLADLARDAGFTNWAKLDVSTIDLKQEVRDMCAVNTCGMYNKRWSCPPGCGDLETCRAKVEKYTEGILVQTVGNLEDEMDYETMTETNQKHMETFLKFYEQLRPLYPGMLAIGAGGCKQCQTCTYPDQPCRFPDKLVIPMEAYGMLVSQVCKDNGVKYYYGPDAICFVGCFLFK